MKQRTPLYSAPRRPSAPATPVAAPAEVVAAAPAASGAAAPARRWQWRRLLLALFSLMVIGALWWQYGPQLPKPLTQKDIDRAVLHTLSKTNLPSPAAKAYAAVRGSVVKVIGYSRPEAKSQTLRLWSAEAETARWPSGVTATDFTE